MTDSCSPRKLDPGFAATNSTPNDLMTSIMKSEPGRSVVCTSTIAGGAVSAAISLAVGDGALARLGSDCCACATVGVATSAAAPAPAPFKNPRRLAMIPPFAEAFEDHSAPCTRCQADLAGC